MEKLLVCCWGWWMPMNFTGNDLIFFWFLSNVAALPLLAVILLSLDSFTTFVSYWVNHKAMSDCYFLLCDRVHLHRKWSNMETVSEISADSWRRFILGQCYLLQVFAVHVSFAPGGFLILISDKRQVFFVFTIFILCLLKLVHHF